MNGGKEREKKNEGSVFSPSIVALTADVESGCGLVRCTCLPQEPFRLVMFAFRTFLVHGGERIQFLFVYLEHLVLGGCRYHRCLGIVLHLVTAGGIPANGDSGFVFAGEHE